MKLHELKPAEGSITKEKRVGRGSGSGMGKTSTRGQKGQWSRSGGGVRPGFEGGQMPLARRLPKRGFTNVFAKKYSVINISDLERVQGTDIVTAEVLKQQGIISKIEKDGLKVLGRGELTKKLTVKAAKFSASAQQSIQAVGGVAEVMQ